MKLRHYLGIPALLAIAFAIWWGRTAYLDREAQHNTERASFIRRIDSLTTDGVHSRALAAWALQYADRSRRSADSIHTIPIEEIYHEAEATLHTAELDSLQDVLLTTP